MYYNDLCFSQRCNDLCSVLLSRQPTHEVVMPLKLCLLATLHETVVSLPSWRGRRNLGGFHISYCHVGRTAAGRVSRHIGQAREVMNPALYKYIALLCKMSKIRTQIDSVTFFTARDLEGRIEAFC